MVVKVKQKIEKTRHVKNKDKNNKYILRGDRNVRYHDRILSKKKKSYNFKILLESIFRIKILQKTLLANFLILLFLAYPSDHSWQSSPPNHLSVFQAL